MFKMNNHAITSLVILPSSNFQFESLATGSTNNRSDLLVTGDRLGETMVYTMDGMFIGNLGANSWDLGDTSTWRFVIDERESKVIDLKTRRFEEGRRERDSMTYRCKKQYNDTIKKVEIADERRKKLMEELIMSKLSRKKKKGKKKQQRRSVSFKDPNDHPEKSPPSTNRTSESSSMAHRRSSNIPPSSKIMRKEVDFLSSINSRYPIEDVAQSLREIDLVRDQVKSKIR